MEFENKAKDAEIAGDFPSAIKYYLQAIDALKEMELLQGLQFDIGNILNRIANLYSELGDFEKAIQFFKQAIDAFSGSDEDLTKVYRLVGECYSNIGACLIAASESNYKVSLEHFQKASEFLEKAAEFEDAVLRRYVVERVVFNLALSIFCLINLNKEKDTISFLEKAVSLIKNYKLHGFAANLIYFFLHLINKKFNEAHLILKEKIEDAADATLFSSSLQAVIIGHIMDLAAKHIPEASILQNRIVEEKGEVILTKTLFEDLLLYGLSFANAKMPRSQFKEVMALLVGKTQNDDVIITEVVPIASGSDLEVVFQDEHYAKSEMINDLAAERNEFIVGWYHTHPAIGLFLSPTDIINQLGYQSLNDKAIAIVFDHNQMTSASPGLSIFRLDDPSLGQASAFHAVRWRMKDASKEIFAESSSLFEKFLTNLHNLILKPRQISLTQLTKQINRSEMFLTEIIPQLITLRYLPDVQFDPITKVISLKK
jgi:tetratricopeptide (TPR) repeat protein/proteasome lid subunit RPN8/RPN11